MVRKVADTQIRLSSRASSPLSLNISPIIGRGGIKENDHQITSHEVIKCKEAVIDGSYLMGYDIDVKVIGQLEIVGFDAADVRRFFTD